MKKELQKQETKSMEEMNEKKVKAPLVDIYENKEEIVLVADMPGIDPDSLDVSFEKDELQINGTVEKKEENVNYSVRESLPYDYYRAFKLPKGLNYSKVKAEYKDGVLKLSIPKDEDNKTHKVKVTVG